MCIKIVKLNKEVEYDSSIPLEDQILGSKQVIVNYDPLDPSIDKFLDEVERFCKNGISTKLNIKFNHNNYIKGIKTKKDAQKLTKDLELNEFIKMMVLIQSQVDKKLEEISELCSKY